MFVACAFLWTNHLKPQFPGESRWVLCYKGGPVEVVASDPALASNAMEQR